MCGCATYLCVPFDLQLAQESDASFDGAPRCIAFCDRIYGSYHSMQVCFKIVLGSFE